MQTPTTPGIYDVPEAAYHSGSGISNSSLKHMGKSPAHYKAALEEEHVDSAALAFGSLFHMLVLEPERFDAEVWTAPNCARRSKDEKQTWADFWECSEGKIRVDAQGSIVYKDKNGVIKKDSLLNVETARKMADSVMAHPIAAKIFGKGLKEKSIYSLDPDTGILKRCRIDCIPDYSNVIFDLKSTLDASPAGFAKSIANFEYHVQGAYYLDIANEQKLEREVFGFVAVEKSPPYAVGVYQLSQDFLEIGRATYRERLDLLCECEAKDEWPAYGTEIIEALPPIWMV